MASDTGGQGQTGEIWMKFWIDQGIGAWVACQVGGKKRVGGMTEEWEQEVFSRNDNEF